VTLTDWMERKGLSQAEVCDGAGVSRAALCRFLNGKAALSPKNMERIVRFTMGKVGYDDLLREAGVIGVARASQ